MQLLYKCCINLFFAIKKCIRIITLPPDLAHTLPVFDRLSILPFNKLVIHRVGFMMYTFTNGLQPIVMNEFYHKHNEIHAHNTRNKENFLISRGTGNPVSMSAPVWNALATKININVTLPIFRKKH